LASPYQYPWVNFFSDPTSAIDSTPIIVCGKTHTSIIDSIFVCNTTDQDIFIDITKLSERNLVPITTYRKRKFLIPANGSADLITANQEDSLLILEAGDLLYANSDFSGNTFDCEVSGRQLLED
jgi:hypothetical protein